METNYLPQTSDFTDGPRVKRRRVQLAPDARMDTVDSMETLSEYKKSPRHSQVAPRDADAADDLCPNSLWHVDSYHKLIR